jgi:hypothetical protein
MLKNILLLATCLILIVLIPINSFPQGSVNLEDRIGISQKKVKQIAQEDGYSIESFTVSGMKILRTVHENTIITYSGDPVKIILASFFCLSENAALSTIITVYQSLESRGFIITDRDWDSITLKDKSRTIGIFKRLPQDCGYEVLLMIGKRVN